ncbi:MAG: hypothetical protein ABIO44_11250, partial [Saprospiraceae bacterium]
FFTKDMYLQDRGRNNLEKSLFVIKDGFCIAYGYLDIDHPYTSSEQLINALDPYRGNIESNGIIRRFLQGKHNIKVQLISDH